MQKIYKQIYGESFPKVAFNLGDKGNDHRPNRLEHAMTYNIDKPESKDFCGADWTFWHWPSVGVKNSMETFKMMAEAGRSDAQTNKAAWFGNMHSAAPGSKERKTRTALVEVFGRRHRNKFECFHVNSVAGKHLFTSMPDLARKYKYLIDVGGNGYSGRTKFLLFSGRPLIFVERKYVEYFQDDLRPWEHYVPVKEDLSDLMSAYEWLRDNESKALEIAANAQKFALENFTIEKVLERIRFACLNIIKKQAEDPRLNA